MNPKGGESAVLLLRLASNYYRKNDRKIIKTSEENLISMLEGKKDISEFIKKTREMLDEIGTDIVSEALRATDRIVKKDKSRKRD